MRIAVTGATGFVGQALCPFLENRLQAEIIKLTRKPAQSTHELSFLATDQELAEGLIGVDCLIHLAARAHTNNSTSADFERDNVALTKRVAKLCLDAKIPRIIYLSSIKVNGNSTSGRTPYSADESPEPEDIYGQSKLQCESFIQLHFNNTETQWVIIRPPLVYGDQNKGNLLALEQLITKKIPLPFGKLNNHRDLVSIKNLCSLITLCVTHPKAVNEVFLVSDGASRSTGEIVKLLANRKKIRARVFYFPNWIFSWIKHLAPSMIERLTGDLQVDITKTKSLLGWSPDNK